MKIITYAKFQMTDVIGEYIPIAEESYDYDGPLALGCFGGASSQEKNLAGEQANFYSTLQNSFQQNFGQQSAILGQLNSSLEPILNGGINQYGFSAPEDAAIRSASTSGTAQAAKFANQATGEQLAAVGGGNTFLPSGTEAGIKANTNTQFAEQNAQNQLGITQAGYALGRQNYLTALGGLSGVANTLNPTGYAGSANQAGSSAFGSASQINQQNQQGMQSLLGLAGGALGAGLSAIPGNPGGGLDIATNVLGAL